MDPAAKTEYVRAVPKKPGPFVAICIIGIILGGLMVLSAGYGVLNVLLGGKMGSVGPPGSTPAARELTEEMQRRMYEATMPPVATLVALVRGAVGAGLVTGLAYTVRLVLRWRERVLTVLVAAAVWELAEIAYTVAAGLRAYDVMTDFASRLLSLGSSVPPGFASGLSSVMGVTFVVSLAFGVGWSIAKIAFLVFARTYIAHDKLTPLFSGASPP